MLAIALTGLARSGKDTVANFLAENSGFEKFVFSDLLKEELEKRKMRPTKMNLSIVGDGLRKKQGMDVLGKLMWKKIRGKKKVVLVGCRSLEETRLLKKKVGKKFFLVAVKASVAKRFERKTPHDPTEKDGFKERDERDVKLKGLGSVIKNADFTLQNNSTKKDLFKKTKKLLEKIERTNGKIYK